VHSVLRHQPAGAAGVVPGRGPDRGHLAAGRDGSVAAVAEQPGRIPESGQFGTNIRAAGEGCGRTNSMTPLHLIAVAFGGQPGGPVAGAPNRQLIERLQRELQ